jgi:secretion/DNA translocation related CpaE-like protein
VLVMVSDVDVLDAVLRTAAAAGGEVVRALDPTEARRSWPAASVILLDASSARACADSGLPRRAGVIVAVSGEPLPEAWKHAVAVGAEHVISLPEAEPWLVAALAQAVEGGGGDGAVLAIVGGRGGAGASVFAVATAGQAARSGDRVLLVDCDPLGGGLDLVLGAEDLGGLRWPGVGTGVGRVSGALCCTSGTGTRPPGRARRAVVRPVGARALARRGGIGAGRRPPSGRDGRL